MFLALVVALAAVLVLWGCVATRGAAPIGVPSKKPPAAKDVSPRARAEKQAAARQAPKTDEAAQLDAEPEEKKVVEAAAAPSTTNERIREALGEADEWRKRALGKPGIVTFRVLSSQLDTRGNKSSRTYFLVSYEEQKQAILAARASYEKVLAMDPANAQALLGLGNLALMEAMTHITEQTQLNYDLGYQQEGMSADAKAHYDVKLKLLQMKIESALVAARSKFKTVLLMSPVDPTAHLGIGMALALGRDWAGAQQKFDQMERSGIFPPYNRSIMHIWYGFTLEQLGQKEQAVAKYWQAVELQEPYNAAEWARARVEKIHFFPPTAEYYPVVK
jgi:tetratricopeptide (TPR) repeat protein